jgi:hypothetical protein
MDLIDDDIVSTALRRRDNILTETLQKEEKVNYKSFEKSIAKRKEFLAQNIDVKMEDPANGNHCKFSVARKGLRSQFVLNALIRKSQFSNQEIDYFVDQDGNMFWLEDMFTKSLPAPYFYTIIPKVRRLPEDIKRSNCYIGETIIKLQNVPHKCQDE